MICNFDTCRSKQPSVSLCESSVACDRGSLLRSAISRSLWDACTMLGLAAVCLLGLYVVLWVTHAMRLWT